jgi:hypothetical protein
LRLKDPAFMSSFSGADDFAIGQDSVYVTRGSGDYHEDKGGISRFAVPDLGSDYGVSLSAG